MFFQLSLPSSLPSPEALHTLESLALGAPGTLTVEALTREQRAATAQRAHCRLATPRDGSPAAGAIRVAVGGGTGAALTFTP